ncbi:hypothetical protein GV67_07110 [Pseudorhizobium pelagicum]|uniref:Uncharacterized protein n=1 Tax=Pseudorhizobium pelagicum TaxID=1509405 RepID=A0A922NY04_9HYPH|nr:hypothetical protein GV68_19390 [Pseudorhizobium pelagicum]KEQ04874.1 hypothetical protein GV67_07110 [Pseudorhizobium pelagicum]
MDASRLVFFFIRSDPRPDLLAGDSIGYRERPAFIALSMDCATAPVPGFFLSARMAGLNPSSALQPQSLLAQARLNPGRGQKCAGIAAAPATALWVLSSHRPQSMVDLRCQQGGRSSTKQPEPQPPHDLAYQNGDGNRRGHPGQACGARRCGRVIDDLLPDDGDLCVHLGDLLL